MAFGGVGESHALVAELFVEPGSLKSVAVDSHDTATAPWRFRLGGTNEMRTKAASTMVLADPQPLDLGVPTPRASIKSCDQVAVGVADVAAE